MLHVKVPIVAVSLLFMANSSFANKFDYLKPLMNTSKQWTPETAPENVDKNVERKFTNLEPFYEEFAQDGIVTVYFGLGYELYDTDEPARFAAMLQKIFVQEGTAVTDWQFSDHNLKFSVPSKNVSFDITFGSERNEFKGAFAQYEIVIYGGHSRYGRGPAFESMQNYYRWGNVFETIEVSTQNVYFQNEPFLMTDMYPLKDVTLSGVAYQYQYRGEKDHSSYLSDNSYTKIIPGHDKDFQETEFSPGKQLIVIWSCSNYHYFKEPIRTRFPNVEEKFVFGTMEAVWVSAVIPAAAILVGSVAAQRDVDTILADLKELDGCDKEPCFTTY